MKLVIKVWTGIQIVLVNYDDGSEGHAPPRRRLLELKFWSVTHNMWREIIWIKFVVIVPFKIIETEEKLKDTRTTLRDRRFISGM